MKRKLVLTLSGGMDSSVLLYMAQDRGYDEIHTITFDYGQRHTRELACVDKQIDNFNKQFNGWFNLKVTNKVLDVKYIKDIAPTSSLTNKDIDNPDISKMAGDAQPVSYVPFRNLMFLSICSSYAESVGADTVWYGAAQVDSLAGYWDGSEEFVDVVNNVTDLNRENRIVIEAPLLDMSKAEIIEEGIRLGVKFKDTWTCYSEGKVKSSDKSWELIADATTPSSSMRVKGFVDAGYKDPITYIQQDKLDKLYEENNCKECA
jgi:7-cyano-7-deazaguanine synthase